ncbi:TPA: small membrane protein YoaI [Escherichia coli]|nr:hypothetical protein [Escherichia coli]HDE7379326.1 hypothetical protein [Escherichia coli]
MNDQMFVETLIITSSFFAIAVVLVLSVLLIETDRLVTQCGGN